MPTSTANRAGSIPTAKIEIKGDVNGTLIAGNNNSIKYETHHHHGVVINRYSSRSAVKPWGVKPQPPAAPRDFIGRENELKTLSDSIRTNSAIVIQGPDGIGKTTLVKKAAHSDAASAMRNGVVYERAVDAAGKSLGFEDILQRLFDALFESNPPLKVTTSTARTHLSNTKPLVILDGFDLTPTVLMSLPDCFPQGSLIVTRQSGYPTQEIDSIALLPLSSQESVELLIVKARLQRNPQEIILVNELCQLLENVPLAITTVSHAIREKRTTLSEAANTLRRFPSSSPDKTQDAIRKSYALVYSMLRGEEREALIATAVAAGISLDRGILETMAGSETIGSLERLEYLQANSPRLRLPDGLRQVVRSTAINEDTAREKILNRLTHQLQTRALDFDFVSGELGNLLGLIQWAGSKNRWSDVIALGKAIDPFLTLRGLWDAWQKTLEQILSAADQLSDTATRAWALHQLGTREAGYGNLKQAKSLLEQALEIRKSIGDDIGAAYTQHNLWVLFPPPPVQRDPGGGSTFLPGRSLLPWILSGVVALAVILAAIYPWWSTYVNDAYGFEFKYPGNGLLAERAVTSGSVASIELPSAAGDLYEKHLDVVVTNSPSEYPCQIPINSQGWDVRSTAVNDIQFILATQKTLLERKSNYEVYATKRDENTWICLVFSFSPRAASDPIEGKPVERMETDETDIFRKIVETFRWRGTSDDIFITSTNTPTQLSITPPTPTYTHTPTPSFTPTITNTPTPTTTFTPSPTATSTPCFPNTAWSIYTVQSGDTLFQISLWYSDLGVTVIDLQKANCKLTGDIRIGERLYVPRTPPPATIYGVVFSDPNNNHVQDIGETRLSNVTVTLTNANGSIVTATTTNANGEFRFSNLTYGLYQVFQYYVYVKPNQTIVQNFGVAPAP
ncbi:MAG: carboxypeptidase regulatory-like domain-containing protein [Anaerolineales bacterium]|nr:carboxypeptidase regulatory-like domain-containing protein [Anaerolineales bacterium]